MRILDRLVTKNKKRGSPTVHAWHCKVWCTHGRHQSQDGWQSNNVHGMHRMARTHEQLSNLWWMPSTVHCILWCHARTIGDPYSYSNIKIWELVYLIMINQIFHSNNAFLSTHDCGGFNKFRRLLRVEQRCGQVIACFPRDNQHFSSKAWDMKCIFISDIHWLDQQ